MHTDEKDQNATTAKFHFLGSIFFSFFSSFAASQFLFCKCFWDRQPLHTEHSRRHCRYAWPFDDFLFSMIYFPTSRLASTFDSILFYSVPFCVFSTHSVRFASIQFAIVWHYRFTRFCRTLLRQHFDSRNMQRMHKTISMLFFSLPFLWTRKKSENICGKYDKLNGKCKAKLQHRLISVRRIIVFFLILFIPFSVVYVFVMYILSLSWLSLCKRTSLARTRFIFFLSMVVRCRIDMKK